MNYPRNPIRQLRQDQRLTLQQICSILDCDVMDWKRYELGAQVPDWIFWRIERAFNIDHTKLKKEFLAYRKWNYRMRMLDAEFSPRASEY